MGFKPKAFTTRGNETSDISDMGCTITVHCKATGQLLGNCNCIKIQFTTFKTTPLHLLSAF
jgi:hypothetical protein